GENLPKQVTDRVWVVTRASAPPEKVPNRPGLFAAHALAAQVAAAGLDDRSGIGRYDADAAPAAAAHRDDAELLERAQRLAQHPPANVEASGQFLFRPQARSDRPALVEDHFADGPL